MGCRAPCDCRNPTTWVPTTDEVECYSGCAESPCAYAILSPCSWQKSDETAFLHEITILWRECLFNGEYSARKGCGIDLSGSESGGDYTRPMEFGSAQMTNACDDCGWTAEEKATSGRVWHLIIGGSPPGSYPDPPDSPTASLILNTVTCSVGGAITETPIAAYVSYDTWSCLGRNTMIFHGCYDTPCDDLAKYLPKQICVVPYASNWSHPCGIDSPDLCPCEDPGCPNIAIDVTIECATPVSGTVVLSRETDGCVATSASLDLCGDIDWPTNDCGAFVGMLDNSCDLNLKQYWFVLWCELGTWTLDTYCVLIDDTGSPATLTSVTNINSQELTRINVCEEVFVESGIGVGDYLDEMFEPVTISPSPDDEGCCEECAPTTVDTDCCDDMPLTLYATFTHTGPGACAAVDGQVVELTYVGTDASGHYWQGTLAVCANYDVIFHQQFAPSYSPPGDCGHYIRVENTGGGTDCIFSGENNTPQCPLVSVSFTMQNWSKANCAGCCTELIGGQFTITVTP